MVDNKENVENPSEEVIKKETMPDAEIKTEEQTTASTNGKKSEGTEPETPTEELAFDWESFEKTDTLEKDNRKDLEKIYEESLSTVVEKEITDGTVIEINKKEVVVDIGFKSNGIISNNEFRYNPELKIGDKVEVYVESQEDRNGELILSHKKARMVRAWERVKDAFKNEEVIKGYIKARTKGGMIIDVFGIEAFMPGSQIDVKPVKDFDQYVDQLMEVKIIKINEDFKNVVVSRKVLIEPIIAAEKDKIIAKLEKGQILEGVVKNVTSYGVFVDLGGIDGLIHITDLSWERISYPTEVVKLEQKIQVVILDFDNEKRRIALGLKQLKPHPWEQLDPNMKVGDIVKGKVVVLADYGAFIEIAPGIEGLIHVSEISWSQHLRSAQDFLKIGDEVEAMILTFDREERKISLGIKQLKPDPWKDIVKKYPINSKHKAIVRNFTKFGVFVEMEEGVDGLIHISDLSWTKRIKHPAEFTSLKAEIEVVVLDIDIDNNKLSLGHKQLEDNPWDTYETIFTIDSIHQGKIVELVEKGAIVLLPHGVKGFSGKRQLVKQDRSRAKAGEELPFKVLDFSKASQKIILSHTRTFEDDLMAKEFGQKKKTDKKIRSINKSVSKTTLGDIKELAELKDTKLKEETKESKKETPKKKEKKVPAKAAAKKAPKPKIGPKADTKAKPKVEPKGTKAETKVATKEAKADTKASKTESKSTKVETKEPETEDKAIKVDAKKSKTASKKTKVETKETKAEAKSKSKTPPAKK